MARKRKRTGTGGGGHGGEVATATAVPVDSAWSGYDGANYSMRRSQIFWPTTDTRRELDSFSRWELQKRVRWLFANVGFLRGFVRNSATLVGWLTPQARTSDLKWNEKQERLFKMRTMSAKSFDRAGKFNFTSAQLMLQRRAAIDGDILTVLTTNEEGNAPAVMFYEAHQLANPEDGGEAWHDGVKIGKGGRHLAYGIKGDTDKVTVIPASSCVYFGAFDSPGHTRAISPFAHAVNHAMDITEIRADTKLNIKTAAQVGITLTSTAEAPQTKSTQGMPGTLARRNVSVPTGPGGTAEPRAMETRDIYTSGAIAELGPGKKAEILHDSRPSPNQMQFEDVLLRDIAAGRGLPVEVVYKMVNLTGPGVRFVMDFASRWIDIEQEGLRGWTLPVWLYFTAWEIAHGNLELPGKGEDWMMAAEFLPQADLTVDRGRDGKLMLDILERGYGTNADFQRKMFGGDSESQTRRHVQEIKFREQVCREEGVEYERAYPPVAGAAPQQKEEEEEKPAGGGSAE